MTKLQKILVVDASRVIRASLAKYLKGHFDIAEEGSGESAWQTLVLDPSIVAVVAGAHLAKLDGIGLVERVRASKLSRLNGLPFFLLVSDTHADSERQRAWQAGVSGFIPKSLSASAIDGLVEMLGQPAGTPADRRLVRGRTVAEAVVAVVAPDRAGQGDPGVGDLMGQMAGLVGLAGSEADRGSVVEAPGGGRRVLLRQDLEAGLQALLPAAGGGQHVGVLVFGLDRYEAVLGSFGEELAERVDQRFAGLLARKIRADDSIGQLAPGRIVIVAPHTSRALCSGFADRVCKALAAAQVSVHGRRVDLTVSVGIAAVPEDGVAMSGAELLQLAVGRLDTAIRAGGNRVVSGACAAASALDQAEFVGRLKALLAGMPPEAMVPCLGNIGLQIMPILTQLEQAFHFGLPIEDMGRRLWARARAERMTM